ncbi:uncharacterized protein BJ212DRAFT_811691 [Suillus subaureus]|uniref:Uncharacterized protein n=1 Tax=Suillus subaureus TaxID=48587 RepID=A0A9P7AQ09_9AGAM|nr:uncharacterized protein BJ212DRAFT_722548 [Suillus subaureus]XP_041196956.1 uncharacterized protein BJ212DRAFT_811691 [Suillus subaureus]KAG1794019.1 hypothetical protein BJ212DRAFT_722548 [Suillus subaureus]KAG1822550.1 hypothetical protein BJ212DRAFT_811691 [Suillus subaureus]
MCILLYVRTASMVVTHIPQGAALSTHSARLIWFVLNSMSSTLPARLQVMGQRLSPGWTCLFSKEVPVHIEQLKDVWLVLPSSFPVKCTSPSDIYISLKPSCFVSHDRSIDTVFERRQCDPRIHHRIN